MEAPLKTVFVRPTPAGCGVPNPGIGAKALPSVGLTLVYSFLTLITHHLLADGGRGASMPSHHRGLGREKGISCFSEIFSTMIPRRPPLAWTWPVTSTCLPM